MPSAHPTRTPPTSSPAVQPNLAWAPGKLDAANPPKRGQVVDLPASLNAGSAAAGGLSQVVLPVKGEGVFIAPSANVMGDVSIGAHSSIWYGVVLRGGCLSWAAPCARMHDQPSHALGQAWPAAAAAAAVNVGACGMGGAPSLTRALAPSPACKKSLCLQQFTLRDQEQEQQQPAAGVGSSLWASVQARSTQTPLPAMANAQSVRLPAASHARTPHARR